MGFVPCKDVFCYVTDVTFGQDLRGLAASEAKPVIRGLELPVTSPDLGGGEKGWS